MKKYLLGFLLFASLVIGSADAAQQSRTAFQSASSTRLTTGGGTTAPQLNTLLQNLSDSALFLNTDVPAAGSLLMSGTNSLSAVTLGTGLNLSAGTLSVNGNYLTALTGDVTASGPGSAAATLATVNSNTGTFGSSTLAPVITVNGKGLITAISTTPISGGSATSPAGTNGALQYNSSGSFGGAVVTGLVKGNGTSAPSAATAGTDYQSPISLTTTGSSGAATFSGNTLNIPQYSGGTSSPLTTKGDLYTFDTSNARLPVGTDGQYLTADSTQSLGIKWATPPGGSGTVNSGTAGQMANYSSTGTAVSGDSKLIDLSNVLSYGPNGATNPALMVTGSTASGVTGIEIVNNIAGNGVVLRAISSGTSENLILRGKGGTGQINFAPTAGSTTAIFGGERTVLQPGTSSTAGTTRFSYVSAADTSLTASTEAPNIVFDMSNTRTHTVGALTLQRDFLVKPSTHAFAAASTVTDAATLAIGGAPNAGTNGTITNAHGLYIPAQSVSGTITNAYGASISAPSGATNNYAAQFNGTALHNGNLVLSTAGSEFQVKEGTNASMGTATLSSGTVTVSTTKVTANSRIFLQTNGGTLTNVGYPYVSARTAGTSFTITSTNVSDAANVAWIIVEPAP